MCQKILKNKWVYSIGSAIIASLIGYFFFGIGSDKPDFKMNSQYHSGSGDNVVGDKIIQRKLFSDTQYIKSWPEHLGGVDALNLDNVATLKAYFPRDRHRIALITDVVTVGMPDQKNLAGVKGYTTDKAEKILFDSKNPIHKFKFQNRTFSVRLLTINEKKIEGVSKAIEYKFGISESETE